VNSKVEGALFLGGVGVLVYLASRDSKRTSALRSQLDRQEVSDASSRSSGTTKALQKELSALVAEYKSTSDSLTALQGKMADLTTQAKQDEVQYQTQKTQLLKEIAQAQQQISVALEPGAVSTTQPDGYSQGQLAYLQTHQALVPSGDAVIAQGGKYFLGHVVDGSEAPIVSHIVGADPTQGDPGFIVGNRWYGTLAAAEAASRATGMPWNGAVNIDPWEFDAYVSSPQTTTASSHAFHVSHSSAPQRATNSYVEAGSSNHETRRVVVHRNHTYVTSQGTSINSQPRTYAYPTSRTVYEHGAPGMRGSNGEFFPDTLSVSHGSEGYYGSNGHFYQF
jgi:hypothetical protein